MSFLVVAEEKKGTLRNVTFQLIKAALELSKGLTDEAKKAVNVILIGSGSEKHAEKISTLGVKEIFIADNPKFSNYSPVFYAAVLEKVIKDTMPSAVLFGATSAGKDLAPKVAARFKRCLISDVISLNADGDGYITAIRPVYAGKLRAEIKSTVNTLQFITVRQNAFPAAETANGSAKKSKVEIDISGIADLTPVIDRKNPASEKADLTEAQIIVSGGRGLKEAKNFDIIENLADALDATVGASRAAVDAGWKPQSYQVGLTGKTVSPSLYVACGISGAVQHQAGMSSAKVIVAINKDKDAPIFQIADYGIVGDLFDVVPELTAAIKALKEQ